MSELKLELYNTINLKLEDELDFYYSNQETKIKYSTILKIWSDFIFKNYQNIFKIKNKDSLIFQEKNEIHQKIVDLCKQDIQLSIVLEDLFDYHINSVNDDLIIFYIKGSNKVLLKLKSYSPLNRDKTKILPYWNIYINQKDFVESIDKYLVGYPEKSLCILCF